MLKDITLGQFFPGNSFLHRLDPRIKIVLTILIIINIFTAANFLAYIPVVLLVIASVAFSGIPLKIIIKGVRPLLVIIIITTTINMFYTPGDIIFEIGFITLTMQGVKNSLMMIIRIIMLVVSSSLLTYTTSPMMLTDGLEHLMSPLKLIKVPVHEFAMMMTIALRFIPTLIEETDKLISAQKARGADFETGNLIARGKALIPILVPLILSAFRRAEELAVAMLCRCYHGGEGRTRLKQYKLVFIDYLALSITILDLALIIILNYYY